MKITTHTLCTSSMKPSENPSDGDPESSSAVHPGQQPDHSHVCLTHLSHLCRLTHLHNNPFPKKPPPPLSFYPNTPTDSDWFSFCHTATFLSLNSPGSSLLDSNILIPPSPDAHKHTHTEAHTRTLIPPSTPHQSKGPSSWQQ